MKLKISINLELSNQSSSDREAKTWIGLHQKFEILGWQYTDGTPDDYKTTVHGTFRGNDHGISEYNQCMCLITDSPYSWAGQFCHIPCVSTQAFVCKKNVEIVE